jgi:tRNA A-37 threonylcarbamoyl transferase component Bud32
VIPQETTGMSNEAKPCLRCGSPIPDNAPGGLCPKCLLAGAAATPASGSAPSQQTVRPSVESLAAAFPQLEIVEFIGQGGMGFVYRARQPKLDRNVALKILPRSLAGDAAFAERFAREGRLLARLNHPNIVSVYDFGQADGFYYLLMEFVDGVNLRQAMRASRFTPAQALTIVPKICEALQFAHDEGVLHRDIKPENILLDTKGRVKIADFGIAKMVGADQSATRITASGAALGTPHYMAPEQIEKPAAVDHRADIYSLGVVFYELLTGELPLGRFSPPSAKTAVDALVDEVVMKALEKERERRQQSAGEMKTEVETVSRKGHPETGSKEKSTDVGPGAAPLQLKPELKLLLLLGLVIALAYVAAPLLGKLWDLIWQLLNVVLSPGQLGWKLFATLRVGLFGFFLWLVWKYRSLLLAPFGISPSASRPVALTTITLDGVLYWAACAALLVMAAHLITIILLPAIGPLLLTTVGMRPMPRPGPFPGDAFGSNTNAWLRLAAGGNEALFCLALGVWLSWLDSRRLARSDAPANPPGWLKRAGLAFFIAGLLALIGGELVSTPSQSTFHFGTFALVTGLALLTRSRPWRSVALATNWFALAMGGLGSSWMLKGLFIGGAPAYWNIQFLQLPRAIFVAVALAPCLLFVAGLWVLGRRDVLPAFALARSDPSKKVQSTA